MSISAWIVLGIVVVSALWAILSYNRLVAMRQQCNQAFADLDVQLRRPHDIVFNLVETVNGYASHERSTLDAVIEARNAAIAAQRPPAKAQAALGGAVRQLFAVAEAYPNLRPATISKSFKPIWPRSKTSSPAAPIFQQYGSGI